MKLTHSLVPVLAVCGCEVVSDATTKTLTVVRNIW